MKRITIVTDAWHPQINGVVITLDNIIAILKERGYEVSVIHPQLFRIHFPLPTYPEIQIALSTRGRMQKMLRETKPDYVHIVTEGSLGMLARFACKREGFTFTTAYHTHFPLYVSLRVPGMMRLTYAYLRWFHRASSAALVPTESIRADLAAHGFQNLRIWPGGVDTELFRPMQCSTEDAPRPCFVFFGRIAPEKNVEEFLKLSLPGTKLVIGDGPDRARLEKKYGSSARFLGYKKGQELVDAIACTDVAVFPSYTETFGLTIIEALACGIPVAAHNATGPRDILTSGIDGVIDTDLARAAIACLGISKEACREKALQYSWQKTVDTFIQYLHPIHL